MSGGPEFAQTGTGLQAHGTYLLSKIDTSGVDSGVEGKTILSLLPSGFAIMTDSAQGGLDGYQAFGMMQGTWTCSKCGDAGLTVEAMLLDFAYPNDGNPGATLSRVALSGLLDVTTGGFSGQGVVRLCPLTADPFADPAPDATVTYSFKGQKVPNPEGWSEHPRRAR
ncbi:MAG: hypothetical protein AAGA28_10340 [Pseudomonadota bacterium]